MKPILPSGLSWLSWIVLLFAWSSMANANTIMIWPIHPLIESGQSATALWLENRGSKPTLIQLRIFSWEQKNGQDHYYPQEAVIGSPPMMEIHPGQRQLVRLILQTPPPAGKEQAWRLILDEIPVANTTGTDSSAPTGGINLQMRYSLPLFGYGEGLTSTREDSAPSASLGWRVISENKQQFLEIVNRGDKHARLTDVAFIHPAGREIVSAGLLGYVLPGAYQRWPLKVQSRGELFAASSSNQPIHIPPLQPSP